MNVKTAFFNGTINEEVFIEISRGFPNHGDPTKVCRLKRALYGLKQAPKAWYAKINS